jgi:hypothetical protein
MPAGALLAGVVEQPLRDVLPDCVVEMTGSRKSGKKIVWEDGKQRPPMWSEVSKTELSSSIGVCP